MKYYKLHIHFDPSIKTFNEITQILNVFPLPHKKSRFEDSEEPSSWHYQFQEEELDAPFDFINIFLDILNPNFLNLKLLGVEKEDILMWLVIEGVELFSLRFNSLDLLRLGKSEISLNIDYVSK